MFQLYNCQYITDLQLSHSLSDVSVFVYRSYSPDLQPGTRTVSASDILVGSDLFNAFTATAATPIAIFVKAA